MKKKLPQEIVPSEVNNSTYVYVDAMGFLNDMKRLRRKTGWQISWLRTTETHFIFHVTELGNPDSDQEFFAQFEIKIVHVYRDFWPSLHPDDPFVPQLRNWFMTRGGPYKIAAWLNETTTKEVDQPSEKASAWFRLLDDDELV